MARALIVLVLGVLLGVTATLLVRPAPLALPDLGELRPPATASTPSAAAVVSAAAREGGPDFYRRLADANASDLAALIRQAAKEPASTDRDLALAVSLKRYSELDALGAVRLAREAGVSGMALSAVYGAWARTAPGQALAALSTVDSPEAAATVGLALIAALGNDAAAFGRVAAVLAAREENESPEGVTTLAAPPFLAPGAAPAFAAPRALALAAQRWADLDPRRALAAVREIDDARVRLALEAAALRSLARVAPDEVFTQLASVGAESQRAGVLAGTYMELARSNPERLLASVRHLPEELRRMAELVAVQQLAERDAVAAAQYLQSMPAGQERQRFTQVVARAYGKHDAAAALAWARSLPERDNLIGAVLAGVAEQDPHRALDLALELSAPRERMQALQLVAMTSARDDATAEAIANRLFRIDDRRLREAVAFSMVAGWSQRSPESAMRWLLANAEAASPNVFMQMGHQIAMRDPRDAIAYSAQIPPEAREQWIQGVAQGYAQSDPRGAVDWVAQFRGEPWYDTAAMRVAEGVAERDGAAAVRLVEELDPGGPTQQLLNGIVMRWASHDPAAAAEWAISRRTEQERTAVMQSVVGMWSNQDPAGARQWALRLPQGPVRDGAVATVLMATAFQESGGLDPALLNAFTSDGARQQAVMQIVQGLAYRDPAEARAVIDAYLTDPPLRAQAERMLEAARNTATQRAPYRIGISATQ